MTARPWFRLKRNLVPAGALGLGLVVAIVWVVSPWPAALLIRALFTQGAADTVAEMTPYVTEDVDEQLDVSYGDAGADTTLDVFSPLGTDRPLTTVVWIHGGAWISGSKEDVRPYAKLIAARGYTTVSVNYTVAPEAAYPVAVNQLNSALKFLVDNAAEYNIDSSRIVIAGDSAGAQLTSQLANIITNPQFATEMAIKPALKPDQLDAVILNCGIYDVSGIPNAPGIGGWGFRTALWGYLGEKDWSKTPGGSQMSSIDYVTDAFPPTWISGGDADPLTASQSVPLAARLTSLGVPVTSVFYDSTPAPGLPHEYQFHLDYPQAQAALDSTLKFLDDLE